MLSVFDIDVNKLGFSRFFVQATAVLSTMFLGVRDIVLFAFGNNAPMDAATIVQSLIFGVLFSVTIYFKAKKSSKTA